MSNPNLSFTQRFSPFYQEPKKERPYVQESRAGAMMPAPQKPSFTANPQVLSILNRNRPLIKNVRDTFGNEGDLAMSVLLAENTQLNPNQRQFGGGPARGLWQFEPPTWADMGGRPDQMFDADISTQMAKKLRDKRGWGQWSAYNNKKHEEYMPYMDMMR